jgi:hypothetical protein
MKTATKKVTKKTWSTPATGVAIQVGERWSPEALDEWRRQQEDKPGRPRGHPPPCRDRVEGEGEQNLSNNATLAKLVIVALLLSAITIWRAPDRVRGSCHRHCPTDFSAIRK